MSKRVGGEHRLQGQELRIKSKISGTNPPLYPTLSLHNSKKNLNASRPSEHPPVRGENVKTFLSFCVCYWVELGSSSNIGVTGESGSIVEHKLLVYNCIHDCFFQKQKTSMKTPTYVFDFSLEYFLTVSHMSSCPLHTTYRINIGSGKREAHINWSMVVPEKVAPVTGTTLRTTGCVPANSRH